MKKLLLVILLTFTCQVSYCQSAFDRMITKYTKQTDIVANIDATGKDLAKDAQTAEEKAFANRVNKFRMFIIETKRLFPSFKADFATIEKDGYTRLGGTTGSELILAKYNAGGATMNEVVFCDVLPKSAYIARFTGKFTKSDVKIMQSIFK